MTRRVGGESGEGGGDLRKQGAGMLQLSLIKGWVGRVSLVMAFLVGAMGVFLMMGGLGEGQECPADDECVEYPEHGSGSVVGYSAVDPEGESVTWSVSGTDSELFEINEGRLTFKSPPDYENPRDADTNNEYEVTIGATDAVADSDNRIGIRPVPRDLIVVVQNVEEAGTITLSTLQPQEEVSISATLRDPDGGAEDDIPITPAARDLTEDAEWQWERSNRASGPWTDIVDDEDTENVVEGTDEAYTPRTGDVGMYLRATATYEDGRCRPCDTKNTAQAVSVNAVRAKPYANVPPVFEDEHGEEIPQDEGITREVEENSAAGTDVGAPVMATDPGRDGPDVLTYSLATGGDNDSFDIDHATGQITVGVGTGLDYETKATYSVMVTATDPSNRPDTITVTVRVTDVDEAPTIAAPTQSDGFTSKDFAENTAVTTVVSTYEAMDPEDNRNGSTPEALKWSLTGPDASKFSISNRSTDRGQLRFRESPDYENPTDTGQNNLYNVTVRVADLGGNTSTRDVTVNVTNEDEVVTYPITVSNSNPVVGAKVTATLGDPDIPLTNIIWTWDVAASPELTTSSQTTSSYTTKSSDQGNNLTVSVTYTDGTGTRRGPIELDLGNVGAKPFTNNRRPTFASTTTSRTVAENAQAGTPVEGEVTADDPEDNELTYSLSGTDAALFSINQDTGQITTRAVLDHEQKSRYRMTVTAEDPSGSKATTSLTINVTDVDEPPEITSGDITIYYEENGTGTVSTYRATEPEGRPIVWTLSGAAADVFTITGGLLKFKSPPDFENLGNLASTNRYSIMVRAGDGGADSSDEEIITIEVTNLDEEGEVELSAERPKEEVLLTATLTDPDGSTSDVAWQWARASSRTGTYTDISEDGKAATYTPVEDDVGKYMRATATYTDPEGAGKSAHAVSTRATDKKDYVNTAPVFLDANGAELAAPDDGDDGNLVTTDPIARKIAENSRARTNVSAPVTAKDIGRTGRQETLTYSLGGEDAVSFTIVRSTGQIRVKSGITLNFEGTAGQVDNCATLNECVVTVTAADSSGKSNVVTVNIAIVDVDETPTFTAGLNAISHDEGGDPQVGNAYVVDDPEGTDITWSVGGTDADDFSISSSGVLEFQNTPDYEASTDSGRNNVYDITVEATDTGDNTVSRNVRVTVENMEEAGIVILTHTVPEVGANLTASLSDPDRARSVSWRWYRGNVFVDGPPNNTTKCSVQSPTDPCEIDRVTSSTYRPTTADEGSHLTAWARYSDGEGSGKTAGLITADTVKPQDPDNVRPQFLTQADVAITRDTREVEENTEAGDDVGDSVGATDGDTAQDTLVYSLSGTDAASFDIDSTNGQIKTKAALDYETKKSYRVTVKALDPSGASATMTVTINVMDVDEPPELSAKALVAVGRGSISFEENQGGEVARYTATGPSAGNVSWRLSRTDASDFSLSSSGVLTFRSTPNFEAPADSNSDNTYEITVTARSGNEQDELQVTVTVFNVDEMGKVTLSPTRASIGGLITATLTDPDGTATGISWQWARSRDGATGWANISGTNSNSYRADSDDVGYYLQATASYTDPEGSGKSASAKTAGAVLADDDGMVTLSQTQPAIGDTITATLTDPDGRITNTIWQWERSADGESGWVDISGATRRAYTVVAADVGNYLRASASYDDGDGTGKGAEGVTSMAVVEDDDGVLTLSPSQPIDGDTITASLSDPDGRVTNVSWQWEISADGLTSRRNISGATSETYTPETADVGSYLRATARYTDAAGPGKSAEAVTSASVGADDDGVVTLSQSQPVEGETVSATLTDPDGDVTGTTWQWETSPNGAPGWTNISGATFETYTPVAADVGRFIRATASYTDTVGPGKGAESVSSASVSADDDGVVTISPLQPVVGEMVTANLTDPDNGVTGLAWQWQMSPNGSTGLDRQTGSHFTDLHTCSSRRGLLLTGHGHLYRLR